MGKTTGMLPRPAIVLAIASVFATGFVASLAGSSDHAAAGGGTVTLVRVVDTWDWHRPSPDPSGISRIGNTSRFAVVDGEVDETHLWQGANVWFTRRSLSPLEAWSSRRFSSEPTDVAMPTRRLIFLSDDGHKRVFRVRAGRDGDFGTSDDEKTFFSTRPFGSRDPEGLAFGRGMLFVADGDASQVFRVDPGRDGRFGGGVHNDDRVTSFDTRRLGLDGPEGIAYFAGDLFLVSRDNDVIVRTTLDGGVIATYDISSSRIKNPSGIAVLRNNASLMAYVTDRGVDNNLQPSENDGMVFAFSLN